MTRRITYVTGTRADFGLMLPTLRRIDACDTLALDVVVTGMHLSPLFGGTVREVEASGLTVSARIPVPIEDDSAAGMARCGGIVTEATAERLGQEPPDALLLLGDRSEMLAAGFSGFLAGVPVVHLCGGERSGTIDDSLRHALSRLASLHLVATEEAGDRLIRSGEEPWRVIRVGTPGLVGIDALSREISREELAQRYGIGAGPYALLLFHPVVQDAALGGEQAAAILSALADRGLPVVALLPNADHGQTAIRQQVGAAQGAVVIDHMPRADYLAAMRHAAVLIGNSSSGIIESASLGTPTVNVGERQAGRARNANVVDCGATAGEIAHALDTALRQDRTSIANLYGDGQTDQRVTDILAGPLLDDPRLLRKRMTF